MNKMLSLVGTPPKDQPVQFVEEKGKTLILRSFRDHPLAAVSLVLTKVEPTVGEGPMPRFMLQGSRIRSNDRCEVMAAWYLTPHDVAYALHTMRYDAEVHVENDAEVHRDALIFQELELQPFWG